MDKLLLVEDDPTLIRMLTSFLSDENFQITSVTRQQAATAAMEADKPDLALVDISLAEGNGFAVCANAKTLGVPVLAVGVPTVIDASALCRKEGIEQMFVTPRDIDSQVRALGKILGYGINMALHPGLGVEDMEMLLG